MPRPRRRALGALQPRAGALQPGLRRRGAGALLRLAPPPLPLLLLLLAVAALLPMPAAGFSSRLHTSLSPQNPPPPELTGAGVRTTVTPRDFLAQRPPGPYTCLRARDRALLGFDFHLARLLHAIRASGGQVEEPALRDMMLTTVGAVVDEALVEHARQEAAAAAEAAASGKPRKAPQPLDAFVTVHASLPKGPGQASKLELSAHAVPMCFAVPPPPVVLEVRGDGRRDPDVKHSQWLWDRQELERYRIGAGGEVALSRPCADGRGGREILEGLVTNIFAFRGNQLLTAGDGVLPGHIRELVLDAARSLGMEVGHGPLRLDEVQTWDEAFLTGSGRILVPIKRVEGTSVGLPAVDLPSPVPGPLTTRLRQRLLFDIDEGWVPLEQLR